MNAIPSTYKEALNKGYQDFYFNLIPGFIDPLVKPEDCPIKNNNDNRLLYVDLPSHYANRIKRQYLVNWSV